MFYDKILPFVEYAPVVSSERNEQLPIADLFFPFTVSVPDDMRADFDTELRRLRQEFLVFRVKPLGVLILMEDLRFVSWLKEKTDDTIRAKIVTVDYGWLAHDIELFEMLSAYKVNNGYSLSSLVTPDLIHQAELGMAITPEMRAKKYYNPDYPDGNVVAKTSEGVVAEGEFDDLDAASVGAPTADTSKTMKMATYTYLDAYMIDPYNNKSPLLLGGTAVAKSSYIKSVARKNGLRVVDFRLAFVSRLDFNGLSDVQELPDYNPEEAEKGRTKIYQANSPMFEVYQCSKNYREYLQEMVTRMEDYKQSHSSLEPEQIQAINNSLEKMRELLQPPLLFLDEITRAPKSVTDAIFSLLNERKFLGADFSDVRVVAATNVPLKPHGVSQSDFDEVKELLFQVFSGANKALVNRFTPVEITPADVYPTWIEWAKQKEKVVYDFGGHVEKENDPKTGKNVPKKSQNIHPLIIEYFESGNTMRDPVTGIVTQVEPENVVYDFSVIIDAYNAAEPEHKEASTRTPFPNYRTWDIVSHYLYMVDQKTGDNKKVIFRSVVAGLLGERPADNLCTFLGTKGYTLKDEDVPPIDLNGRVSDLVEGKLKDVNGMDVPLKDITGDYMRECMQCGIPCMIAGPTAMGKTSRCNQIGTEDDGSKVVVIDLSTKDRLEIGGYPRQAKVFDELTERISYIKGLPEDLLSTCVEVTNKAVGSDKIPPSLTKRDPVTLLANAVREIEDIHKINPKSNAKLVILFDETNRVEDESVMSSIFEATSDNRYMGVSLNPNYVRIVMACNIGDEYGGKDLDSALVARVSMAWHKNYDYTDLVSFMKYLKDNNKNGKFDMLLDFFKNMSIQEAQDILTEIEQPVSGDMEFKSQGSPRTMENLANLLSKNAAIFEKNPKVYLTYYGHSVLDKDTQDRWNVLSQKSGFTDQDISDLRFIVSRFLSLYEQKTWIGKLGELSGDTIGVTGGTPVPIETFLKENLKFLTVFATGVDSDGNSFDNFSSSKKSALAYKIVNLMNPLVGVEKGAAVARKESFSQMVGASVGSAFLDFYASYLSKEKDFVLGDLVDATNWTNNPKFSSQSAVIRSFVSQRFNKMANKTPEVVAALLEEIVTSPVLKGGGFGAENYKDTVLRVLNGGLLPEEEAGSKIRLAAAFSEEDKRLILLEFMKGAGSAFYQDLESTEGTGYSVRTLVAASFPRKEVQDGADAWKPPSVLVAPSVILKR